MESVMDSLMVPVTSITVLSLTWYAIVMERFPCILCA